MPNVSVPMIVHKGVDVPQAALDALVWLNVTRALNSCATCTIRFSTDEYDPSAILLDDLIEIEARKGGTWHRIFRGKVSSVTIDLASTGTPDAVIECHDASFAFASQPLGRSWLRAKMSDIVTTIAGDVGLYPQVDATTIVFDSLLYAGTALEALDEIVASTGFAWWVDGDMLYVKRPFTGSAVATLDPKSSLSRLRVQVSSVDQAHEVRVAGWDPKQQKEILGRATDPKRSWSWPSRAVRALSGQGLVHKIDYAIAPRPPISQADADDMAQAVMDERTSSGMRGWGQTVDVWPEIVPGTVVAIDSVATEWAGDYPIERVEHEFGADQSFITRFDIGTSAPLASGRDRQTDRQRLFGQLTIGTVTEIRPSSEGTTPDVKVFLPHLSANGQIVSHWARLVLPGAGKERGLLLVPEIDDEVLVGFENGDPNHPVVLGGLWSEHYPPPVELEDLAPSTVDSRSFHSREGHSWTFTDKKTGNREVGFRLEMKNGAFLEINTEEVTLDSAKKPITIKGGSGAEISIDDKGNITIKGATLKLEADQTVEVKSGTDLKLTGGTKLAAEGKAGTEIKGATVKVEGQAMTEVKGAMVKIN